MANIIGTDTDFSSFTKLMRYSGEYTTTVQDSVSVHAIDASGRGASVTDDPHTPWCGVAADRFYENSGQFTSTLRTSIAAPVLNPREVSWDRTDILSTTGTDDKLRLNSGKFTSTISDSLDVTLIDVNPWGISATNAGEGSDTGWSGSGDDKI